MKLRIGRRREWPDPAADPRYQRDRSVDAPDMRIFHLASVPWWEAEIPPKRHRCWSQTIGYLNYFDRVDRCACGATGVHPVGVRSGWVGKNERTS